MGREIRGLREKKKKGKKGGRKKKIQQDMKEEIGEDENVRQEVGGRADDEDDFEKGEERAVIRPADNTRTQHAKWCDLCKTFNTLIIPWYTWADARGPAQSVLKQIPEQ